jgi:hypothetical protein
MNTDKELERLQKAIKAVELYKGFTKKIEVMKQNMAEGGVLPRRYTKDFCFAVNARDRVERYYKNLMKTDENKLQRNDSLLEVS